jgi:hypothetical protein
MPIKFSASKDEIKGLPAIPEGMYEVRLDAFKCTFSKDKQSVNLNPQMRIVGHSQHNDRLPGFFSLNTKAKFLWMDFCHCFGVPVPVDGAGEYEFPGNFGDFAEDEPEKWDYRGPLLGQTGQVYVIQGPARDKQGNIKPGADPRNEIKFFVCKVPGCQERHSDNLIRR